LPGNERENDYLRKSAGGEREEARSEREVFLVFNTHVLAV